jgi:hypothetical protein
MILYRCPKSEKPRRYLYRLAASGGLWGCGVVFESKEEDSPCACLGRKPALFLLAHARPRQIVRFCTCGHLWACGQDVNEPLGLAESGSALARLLRPSLCFDHAEKAMAARTHIVDGCKTVDPVQTERDHYGRGERRPHAQSEALSANVARMLLQESDHAFAKTQHGAPARWPPQQETHQIRVSAKYSPSCYRVSSLIREVLETTAM